MKEKIFDILKTISLEEFGVRDIELCDPKVVQAVVQKGNNVGFAINIDELGIDKAQGEKLIALCHDRIKSNVAIDKLTIALTSHGKATPTINQKKINKPVPIKGIKKIIAVASAKGGVGKSTIAAYLALALQRSGSNVALLDADVYGPSIPHLLHLEDKPKVENDLIIPLLFDKLKVMSIGLLTDKNAAGIWRGPMITKILYQLIHGVNWNNDNIEIDYMIIDMPPGTGDVYLSLAEKFPLDSAIIVSTPQDLSVIDVVKSIDCFRKLNIDILGLIQNMSYLQLENERQYLFGRDGAKKLALEQNIHFLGEIPIIGGISGFISNKTTSSNLEINQICDRIVSTIKNK